ncbi:MAG: WbqC family protein [Bacteroides sp.]|nr:WbqC family protein [Bacteroides sp.]MCM1448148.1 WbqC family protein [Bacteroides sp.]MCM1515378.1 WbqC family protein [Paraprevotella sp.]
MTTAYLGSIQYYSRLLREGCVLDLSVPYRKQTGMNRCYIDSPDGQLALTIPVVNPHGRTAVGDVFISEHGKWRHRHWNALVSSYGQTPYFEYYAEDFFPFYHERAWERLVDFNQAMHSTVMRLLDPFPLIPENRRRAAPYFQMFAARHGFIGNLSIADLLFNMGPEAVYYL